MGGNGLRQLAGLGQQLALAGEDRLRLHPASGGFRLLLRYGLFRCRGSALVILDPAVNGFQFSVQVFNALPQIGKQHIKLVFDSL